MQQAQNNTSCESCDYCKTCEYEVWLCYAIKKPF